MVRHLARGVEDGFSSRLVPGLRSSQDAERLVQEIAYGAGRLRVMERFAAGDAVDGAPDQWRGIAEPGDPEARSGIAVIYVLEGPRGLSDVSARDRALAGFDAWKRRLGSYEAAFRGESSWTAERRHERIFERLSFGGLGRDTRFELLTILGRLGVFDLIAGKLFLIGENEPTWAAKRALGIGDPLLLERRAAALADACGVPLESLDLALRNWGASSRLVRDLAPETVVDPTVLERSMAALGL
ncbi:MAG: hypothetical protein ACP5H2_01775 [Solirubrobacteraceae bacterium]